MFPPPVTRRGRLTPQRLGTVSASALLRAGGAEKCCYASVLVVRSPGACMHKCARTRTIAKHSLLNFCPAFLGLSLLPRLHACVSPAYTPFSRHTCASAPASASARLTLRRPPPRAHPPRAAGGRHARQCVTCHALSRDGCSRVAVTCHARDLPRVTCHAPAPRTSVPVSRHTGVPPPYAPLSLSPPTHWCPSSLHTSVPVSRHTGVPLSRPSVSLVACCCECRIHVISASILPLLSPRAVLI